MASPGARMELRLLLAALMRQRGTALIAVLAIAIGASVASALLHVSGDISRRLRHELRALGPNLLVMPPVPAAGSADAIEAPRFLDVPRTSGELERVGIHGMPLLYTVARVQGEPVTLIGAPLERARTLHPQWKIDAGDPASLVGRRLAERLGLARGDHADVLLPDGATVTLTVGATLEAGGADDESWWLPLDRVQALAHMPDRASLFQARIEGGVDAVRLASARLGAASGIRLVPIGSLTAAESELLRRMRRLMALVTVAALVAAGLCALGTLTDRVLEQRRDFALMKALGAPRERILRQFAVEAVAIGVVGGIAGWLLGLVMAEVIGGEVFHTAIAVRPEVPPVVIGLAVVVAAVSSIGPARLALRVEPAQVLKGE